MSKMKDLALAPKSLSPRVYMTDVQIKQWRAIRREAGLQIDPETAEVSWEYLDSTDPYGIHPPDDEECSPGRGFFARSPGSEVWVFEYDLPEATQNALLEKSRREWAAAKSRNVSRFEDLIVLAEEKHDPIREALQRDVRVVRFEDGKLEVVLEPGASESLVDELSRKLEEWTGRH